MSLYRVLLSRNRFLVSSHRCPPLSSLLSSCCSKTFSSSALITRRTEPILRLPLRFLALGHQMFTNKSIVFCQSKFKRCSSSPPHSHHRLGHVEGNGHPCNSAYLYSKADTAPCHLHTHTHSSNVYPWHCNLSELMAYIQIIAMIIFMLQHK